MKNQKTLAIGLIAASALLAVVSFLLLPDAVVVQLSTGSSNVTTAPKLLAVLLPTALGIGGAAVSLKSKDDLRARGKALMVSGVGILVFVIMLAVNLPRG